MGETSDERRVEPGPYCGGLTEAWYIRGKLGPTGLLWHSGPPAPWEVAVPTGEALGSQDLSHGHFAEGHRCEPCRRIVLRYRAGSAA